MSLTVGTDSWVTMDEADTYFAGRLGSDDWVSGADKEKALRTAYRQIKYNSDYEIGSTVTVNLQYAQMEQAYFLLSFESDISHRKALQSQGVIAAGIVKETYKEDDLSKVALCQMAQMLLKEYASQSHAFLVDIDADEDEYTDGTEKEDV
jgi:hypothetical protein